MKPLNVLHLYRVRLRARALQELFAIVGIAAGVALLFASQVASSSLSSSVAQLSKGIVGNASLQLLARDAQGFEAEMVAKVRHLPGVRVAAPLLEGNAEISGPKGSESVELVGADTSLAKLGGALVRKTKLEGFGGFGALVLPAPLGHKIGIVKFGSEATVKVNGRVEQAPLYALLHASQIGALTSSPIAVTTLEFAQEMSGLQNRVSRVLVEPAPGAEASVRAGLERLAGGRLNVQPANYDETLFTKAAAATNQSTALFAVISALVGFLFAFNAMLLTVPQRRRLIADLRRDGYPPRTVIGVMMFDALVLGVLACVLGLALGEELSIHLFHSNPGYLSSAFAVGSQRVVSAQSVAIAIAGGMLAASVAVLSPLKDIVSRQPLAAITGQGRRRHAQRHALAGAGRERCAWRRPRRSCWRRRNRRCWGWCSWWRRCCCCCRFPLNATLALVRRIAPGITSAVPHVAVMELRAGRARAVAIAATGAVAVFGSVAIEAAHGDLLHGLENAAHDMNAFTDVWVSPAGSYNLLRTTPFAPTDQAKLASLPGVSAVRLYRGGLLDIGERRVWVIAPPREASSLLPASQIVEGDVARAEAQVRARRLGGRVAGDRQRTPPAHRRALCAAHPDPEYLQGRGDRHQHRLGAGRDHHERRGLRARVGLGGRERLQRAALTRRLPGPGQARDRTRARRRRLGLCGADRRRTRRPAARAQPPGPRTPHPDRDADPDRRGAGDGGGDGQHGVAAPPAPGEAEAGGLPARGTVAHDPAGEPAAARRGLRQRGGVRSLRPAVARPRAGQRDQLPRRLLLRHRGGARQPRPGYRGSRGDRRDPRLHRRRRAAGGGVAGLKPSLLSAPRSSGGVGGLCGGALRVRRRACFVPLPGALASSAEAAFWTASLNSPHSSITAILARPMAGNQGSEQRTPNEWSVVWMMTIIFIAFGVVLVASLISLWPSIEHATAATTTAKPGASIATVHLFFGLVAVRVTANTALLLLVVLAGALGSVIHITTSLADFVGNRRFYSSWAAWYLLRPVVGVSLALLFYFAFRGGFFSGNSPPSSVNPYGIAALAGMAGLFSKQATDKLREVFETLFHVSSKAGDAQRKDDLANPVPILSRVDPSNLTAGSPDRELTFHGEHFIDAVTTARIGGVAVDTRFVSEAELVATVPDELAASRQTLTLTVFNRPPGGGSSPPVLFPIT